VSPSLTITQATPTTRRASTPPPNRPRRHTFAGYGLVRQLGV